VTPHQALALGVRLFAIWYALIIVREVLGFFTLPRPLDDTYALVTVIGGSAVSSVIVLTLWFFPKSIARGLLPASSDAPPHALSYRAWFSLGTALLGLWLVASSITPMLRNISVLYVLRPELLSTEDLRSIRVSILFYVVETALGLCLLLGANGLSKLLWRIRDAGAD